MPRTKITQKNKQNKKKNTDKKAKYTKKQKRQAEHIEEGYETRGTSPKTAKRIAWATVNKEAGGGKLAGSGKKRPVKKAKSPTNQRSVNKKKTRQSSK